MVPSPAAEWELLLLLKVRLTYSVSNSVVWQRPNHTHFPVLYSRAPLPIHSKLKFAPKPTQMPTLPSSSFPPGNPKSAGFGCDWFSAIFLDRVICPIILDSTSFKCYMLFIFFFLAYFI